MRNLDNFNYLEERALEWEWKLNEKYGNRAAISAINENEAAVSASDVKSLHTLSGA
jgi:hypothetical protein